MGMIPLLSMMGCVNMENKLTTKQAAKYLGISKEYLRNMRHEQLNHDGPAYTVDKHPKGKACYYEPKDLDSWSSLHKRRKPYMRIRLYTLAMLYFILTVAYGSSRNTDIEFKTQIDQYEKTYNRQVNHISIKLVDKLDKDSVIIGLCYPDDKTIHIKRSFWTGASAISKTNLIFHELGHCDLNRLHDDNEYPDGCPLSLMNTLLIHDNCYLTHKYELIQELIDHKNLVLPDEE